MPTWQDIKAIDTYYQANKGPFRRFFRTRSEFMRWLSVLIQLHAPTDPLTQVDQFQFVQKTLGFFVKKGTTLSYTLATTQLMTLCIASPDAVVFDALRFLYQANAFNKTVFNLIIFNENPVALAQLILTLEQTLSTGSLYCRLGVACEQGEQGIPKNIDAALSFYDLAVKWNHIPALVHLGDFYQKDHTDIPKDEATSFYYYLQAANEGCTQAWPALNRLAKNSDARQQQLSQSPYGYFFKKKSVAPLPKNNSTPSLQHRR